MTRTLTTAGSATFLTVILGLGYLVLKSSGTSPCVEQNKLASPGAEFAACLVEQADATKVVLEFPHRRCGAQSVLARPGRVPLQLVWRNPATLEVQGPAGSSRAGDPASIEVRCRDQRVQVILVEQPR